MIHLVTPHDTLAVRAAILRPYLTAEENLLPEDSESDAFHLAYRKGEETIGVASYYVRQLAPYEGIGYRLRQMGVLASYQNTGIGAEIMRKGFEVLHQRGADYLWCDARKIAFGFYEKQGMQIIGEEFHVPNVGPHKHMIIQF